MEFAALVGLVGSITTIEEALKKYASEEPERFERMELEDFRAYLSETNQKEILKHLEVLISIAFEAKEGTEQANLKLDKLVEYVDDLKRAKEGKPIINIVDPLVDYDMTVGKTPNFSRIDLKLTFRISNLGKVPLEKFSFQLISPKKLFQRVAIKNCINDFEIDSDESSETFCIDETTLNRIEPEQTKKLFVGVIRVEKKNFKKLEEIILNTKVFSSFGSPTRGIKLSDFMIYKGDRLEYEKFWER
jgi:hypothetical protein